MADRPIKILVLGSSNVGKTCLIHRFVGGKYEKDSIATIGLDYHTKGIVINGTVHKLELWDTAGAEKFDSVPPNFYRKASAAVLVYDITNIKSLEKLEGWITNLENYCDNPDVAKIVVGHKIDEERVVSRDKGSVFALKHNALFIEASAKNNQFVDDVFRNVVEKSLICNNNTCKDNAKKGLIELNVEYKEVRKEEVSCACFGRYKS